MYGVLPEVVGKWYTRIPVADASGKVPLPMPLDPQDCEDSEDYTKLWCYCCQPSHGVMIECDNQDCLLQWFHCDCLRIRKQHKGTWYCPSCRKLPNKQKQNKVILIYHLTNHYIT